MVRHIKLQANSWKLQIDDQIHRITHKRCIKFDNLGQSNTILNINTLSNTSKYTQIVIEDVNPTQHTGKVVENNKVCH